MIEIRKYEKKDKNEAMAIWNAVVREGIAFPQDEELTDDTADAFFMSQSYTGIAVDCEANEIVGLYILHPNNVGRCGHICNTSYAVKEGKRGLHIGEQLVKDSLKREPALASAYSSSMPLSPPIFMPCTCMSDLALRNSVLSHKVSA